MPDFNQMTPPASLTNPTGLPVGEFPRHLHKWAGAHEDGSPKLNAYIVVHSAEQMDAELANGWSKEPVMKAPKAARS